MTKIPVQQKNRVVYMIQISFMRFCGSRLRRAWHFELFFFQRKKNSPIKKKYAKRHGIFGEFNYKVEFLEQEFGLLLKNVHRKKK